MFNSSPHLRGVIYVAAIVSQVAAFFINVYDAPLGDAFQQTANFLGALAGVTAVTNIQSRPPVDPHNGG